MTQTAQAVALVCGVIGTLILGFGMSLIMTDLGEIFSSNSHTVMVIGMIVGVVGVLQLEVFQYRMKNEYGVDLRMENLPYEEIRLIDEYPGDLSDLNLGSDAELLEDYRGRSLLVFSSYWAIDFTCRRNPGLKVKEIVVEEG